MNHYILWAKPADASSSCWSIVSRHTSLRATLAEERALIELSECQERTVVTRQVDADIYTGNAPPHSLLVWISQAGQLGWTGDPNDGQHWREALRLWHEAHAKGWHIIVTTPALPLNQCHNQRKETTDGYVGLV